MSDTESRDLVSGGGAEAESATAHTAQSSSAILRRHRVKFVAASTEEQTVTQAAADRSRGQSVSSFYASLVGINKSPESDTPTPPRESPPETSIARLLEKTPVEAPIARLPVEEHSSGHRYLVRYGWHPLQPVGLGAPGREGRRVPVRAEVRPDYAGVGAKVKTRAADAKKQQDAPKKVTKAERKRLQREKTEREKRERQALYDEIVRFRFQPVPALLILASPGTGSLHVHLRLRPDFAAHRRSHINANSQRLSMHHRARSPSARPRQQFPSVLSSSTAASALAPNPASLPRAFSRPPRSSTPSPERKARSASSVRWTYRAIIAGMVAITSLLLLGSFLFSTPSYAVQESWRVRDASCPDYKTFSTRRHTPVTNGPLRLPFQRPISECRTFSSKEVERVIKEVTGRIPDVDLSRLFENCFPNTLDTTVRWHVPGRSPQSFIVTGDINAEWIRDSTNQLSPYLPLAKVDNDIRTLILGAIHTQAEFLTFSPYCNAFQPPAQSHLKPSSNDQSDNVNPPYDPSLVFECKYELDSLASFLNLANMYFEQTGDASFVGSDPYFLEALKNVLQVLDEQALTTYDENGNDRRNRYIFQRQTNVGTETLALQGAGNPTNLNTSLIRSAFRPSDDATILQFFIPANAFVAVELKRAKKLLAAGGYAKMADELFSRGEKIENGVWEHGVYEHKVYGKVFAYEVDGYGSIINMDDANLPSLLSLPLLGFVDAKDEVYQNTRRMLLSKAGNPYFLKGPEFAGIGGPHIGVRYAWPMSLLTLIRTSDDDVEIAAALDLVKKTTGGLGLMHESVNVRRARDYTRSWFAWCNSEFGKTILDLAARKPHLVFGEGAESYSIDSVAGA